MYSLVVYDLSSRFINNGVYRILMSRDPDTTFLLFLRSNLLASVFFFFFFQAEDGIRDLIVTGVQTCALPICKDARSTLAQRLRSTEGATIGEVFTFMSGLYFRGKLAYASAFAQPPDGCGGVDRKSVV